MFRVEFSWKQSCWMGGRVLWSPFNIVCALGDFFLTSRLWRTSLRLIKTTVRIKMENSTVQQSAFVKRTICMNVASLWKPYKTFANLQRHVKTRKSLTRAPRGVEIDMGTDNRASAVHNEQINKWTYQLGFFHKHFWSRFFATMPAPLEEKEKVSMCQGNWS